MNKLCSADQWAYSAAACMAILHSYILYIDVDECAEALDDCQQICPNHVGHHVCACEEGCELESDKKSCSGMNKIIITK